MQRVHPGFILLPNKDSSLHSGCGSTPQSPTAGKRGESWIWKGGCKIRVCVFTPFPLKVLCTRNKNEQQLIKSTEHCFPSNTKVPNENKRVTFNSRRGKAWDKRLELAAIISHQHQSTLCKGSIMGLFILLRKGTEQKAFWCRACCWADPLRYGTTTPREEHKVSTDTWELKAVVTSKHRWDECHESPRKPLAPV